MNCPKCQTDIPTTHINIASDIAQCPNCQNIFKISDNLGMQIDPIFDKNNPPAGAWIKGDSNTLNFDTLLVGATTRSWYALFIVPFMAVWSGFSLSGIYGSQIAAGNFNPFMSLFGIPFLLGTIFMGGIAIMTVAGKVELTLDNQGGRVFTGVGLIGRIQRFTWDEITQVTEEISTSRRGGETWSIQLEGKKRVSFGSMLSTERRYYILKTLQQLLLKKKKSRGFI